jgi:5-(carboxyamino)imidazole ribonucleotide mutase
MGRSYESSGTRISTTSPAVVTDGGPTEDGDEPGIDAPRPVLHVAAMHTAPVIGIIMGSASDWPAMEHAARTLRDFGIPWEAQVISAHRAPGKLVAYAGGARAQGLKCLIAGAGCAAHLAGVTAALTDLPVLGVPMEAGALKGMDALLATVQMPGGIPVATFAIGKAGAINAALFAVAMLANNDAGLAAKLAEFRKKQTAAVESATLPPLDPID